MRRAVAIAVVQFDAMGRGAAEERGIEQIGAPARPGTGIFPAGRTALMTFSAWVAMVPPAPAIITPTVSSRCRRA